MRPSSNPNVVAILDTRAECKVVNDALQDPSLLEDPNFASFDKEFVGRLERRFTAQVMEEPRPTSAYVYVGDIFRKNPEFVVLDDQGDFVLGPAKKILAQDTAYCRAFNKLTKRTKAARTIVNFFETAPN